MEKTLTVQQAIEQGYEYCFYDSDGWQRPTEITDPDINFDRSDLVLASKDQQHVSVDEDTVKRWLADEIINVYDDETGTDDTLDISNDLDELDVTDITAKINSILEKHGYYKSTGIKLTQ